MDVVATEVTEPVMGNTGGGGRERGGGLNVLLAGFETWMSRLRLEIGYVR